jgi:hypothetical protein
MGPLQRDFAGFIRLRISEHTLHSWDIRVVTDPAAVLAPDAVPMVLGALPMVAQYTGTSHGSTAGFRIDTRAPDGHYRVDLSADGVSIATAAAGPPDLTLPAEALVRLVYGRLPPAQTPPFDGSEEALSELRRTFPGI